MAAKKKTAAPEKNKGGRPTKLSARVIDALCELLRQGWFVSHACAEVGISERVFHEWMEDAGKPGASELKKTFAQACTRARAEGEQVFLDRIATKSEAITRDMVPGDWKADAWILERLNPRRYKATDKHEVTGAEGAPLTTVAKVVVLPAEKPLTAPAAEPETKRRGFAITK